MLKSGLVNSSAVEVVEGLRRGDVSPLECLDALEVRISEVDGRINALPTLCFERAALSKHKVGKALILSLIHI